MTLYHAIVSSIKAGLFILIDQTGNDGGDIFTACKKANVFDL